MTVYVTAEWKIGRRSIPENLARVINAVHLGVAHEPFRGVSSTVYGRWLEVPGYKCSRLKTFRLQLDDLEKLKSLQRALGLPSKAEVLRKALRKLEDSRL